MAEPPPGLDTIADGGKNVETCLNVVSSRDAMFFFPYLLCAGGSGLILLCRGASGVFRRFVFSIIYFSLSEASMPKGPNTVEFQAGLVNFGR